MAVSADHFTFGDFRFDRGPTHGGHYAQLVSFDGAWKVVEIQRDRVGVVATICTPTVNLDLLDSRPHQTRSFLASCRVPETDAPLAPQETPASAGPIAIELD